MAALTKISTHEQLGLRVVRSFYAARPGFYTVYEAVLRYRYMREELLAHILGGRDKQEGGQDPPLGEKQLRKITNELIRQGFIMEQTREDMRDKKKYLYYCVDFSRQVKMVMYRIQKMRDHVAQRMEAGQAEAAAGMEDIVYQCINDGCARGFSELDVATMGGSWTCRCGFDIAPVERGDAISEALRFKQLLNENLLPLEDTLKGARESGRGLSAEVLYNESKGKQEMWKISSGFERKAYDDVIEYSRLAGSQDAREEEQEEQHASGVIKLRVTTPKPEPLCAVLADVRYKRLIMECDQAEAKEEYGGKLLEGAWRAKCARAAIEVGKGLPLQSGRLMAQTGEEGLEQGWVVGAWVNYKGTRRQLRSVSLTDGSVRLDGENGPWLACESCALLARTVDVGGDDQA
jgi:transcription initiation factor IIE alpha subunit